MRALTAIGAILSGTNTNNSAPSSPTSPTTPTSSTSESVPATPTTATASLKTPSKPAHSRSSSRISINIAGLMADTVHHEVKLVRYTEYLAQYHSDGNSDDDDYDVDDTKSEKEVQRFFERDWDQHDWDADAEEWEEPDWSQRIREERRFANMRKEARI